MKNFSRLGLLLVSLLGIAVLVTLLLYVTKLAQVKSRVAAIAAAGDPAGIADLEPAGIEPHDNAATYIMRMHLGANEVYKAVSAVLIADNFHLQGDLSADQISRIGDTFADHAQEFEDLKTAFDCRQFVWPLDYSLGPTPFQDVLFDVIGKARMTSRLSDCRARFLVATGRHDAAVDVCLKQLRLCRRQDDHELFLIGFQMNIACRYAALDGLEQLLQVAELSDETHEAIETELAHHDAMDGYVRALMTERVLGIEIFSTLFPTTLWEFENYLDVMEQQISLGAAPDHEIADTELIEARALVALVRTAISRTRDSMEKMRLRIRRLRVRNALAGLPEQARIAVTDIATLGLPVAATTDPYTGKQLTLELNTAGPEILP